MQKRLDTKNGWLDKPYSLKGKRVWVAGHRGMVGAALCRRLELEDCEILTCDFDLRVQSKVENWLRDNRPDVIVIAAAKVGGILANQEAPADFLYDNVMIEANIIHAAAHAQIEKLLFLGSSCIYPADSPQPMKEDSLFSGPLEPSNSAYALAKLTGIKLCETYRFQYKNDFISAHPCNLYGPGDRFDETQSHVIPALMMKMHRGHPFKIWGSGTPLREFLHVDDLADGLVFLLQNYSDSKPINIGSGDEVTITGLAEILKNVTGYSHPLAFDPSKPDGVKRKLLDSSRIKKAGWNPTIDLQSGLQSTYDWYKAQENAKKKSRHAA